MQKNNKLSHKKNKTFTHNKQLWHTLEFLGHKGFETLTLLILEQQFINSAKSNIYKLKMP
jgi:hypothetical protein